MDEIEQRLEVLGLKPGATREDVRQAYRELAMVWHPDRFAADSPLQAKAHAKLRDLKAAHDFFPFEADENGFVTDQSGFKNNGTVRGAKFVREGKIGGAMSFNGRSNPGDSILVRNSASLVSMQRTRQLTLCAWIKLNSLPSEYPVVLTKGGNNPPKAFGGYELALRAVGDGGPYFLSGPYGLVCFYEGDRWFPGHLNEWIHIATVINSAANTGKFYINGRRMDDRAFRGNSHDANFALINDLIIGAPDPNNHPNRACFDGLMDEVRVYARALTTEEIRSLPGFTKSSP